MIEKPIPATEKNVVGKGRMILTSPGECKKESVLASPKM